ncbi:MAG: transposase [Elusimicrobia bacterium]|nr:transposase [Elusimicrobiota bacterium]
MKRDTELSNRDWKRIKPLLPRQRIGRPRTDDRKTLNGILFVLKTGCRWRDVPREYGSPAGCHRRLVAWQKRGVWARVLRVLLGQLGKRGRLKLSHGVLDGSFAPAKRGAAVSVAREAA